MPPRAAGLLERAVVEAIPVPELLSRLGVSEDALGVALWRAAVEFSGGPALPHAEELTSGRALLSALATDDALPAPVAALEPLRQNAAEVFHLAEARHALHSRLDPWIRGACALVLIVLALWLSR